MMIKPVTNGKKNHSLDAATVTDGTNGNKAAVISTDEDNSQDDELVTSPDQNNSDEDLRASLTPAEPLPAPLTHDEKIATGERLIEAKAVFRGEFKAWVEKHCAFSYMSATRYMKVCEAEQEARWKERLAEYEAYGAELRQVFAPSRTAPSIATEDEINGAVAVLTGLDQEEVVGGYNRALAYVFALHKHFTWSDLVRVTQRAKFVAIVLQVQADALLALAKSMPADGLVSSCELAMRVEAADHSAAAEEVSA